MSNMEFCTVLENVGVALHRINNLLQLCEEGIEDELKGLEDCTSDAVARHFIARYDAFRSLLEIIQLHSRDTAKSVQSQVNAIVATVQAETERIA